MQNWEKGELGKFVTLKRGFDLPQQKRDSGEVPIFSSSGITGMHSKTMVKAPGVITGRYGTIGQVFFSSKDFWPLNTTLFVEDFHGNDEKFVYYFLKTLNWKNFASASAVPGINRNTVHKELVCFPGIKSQKKIAGILSLLDDKIETNQNINDNLQQQARALFYEWFISTSHNGETYDTELGALPTNFTVMKTGKLPIIVTDYVANGSFASLKENVHLYQERNYAYFIRNTDLKAGTFEVFVDEPSYNFLTKSRLFGGEIIISNVGDVGSVFLCPILDAPMTLGNNIIMIKPLQNELRYYLYIWFKWSMGQGLIQGIKGGSAQPKFNKTDFKSLPIILPPKDLLKMFHSTVCPLFDNIARNQAENRKLAALRDALLPQLMSGEIDVSAVQL